MLRRLHWHLAKKRLVAPTRRAPPPHVRAVQALNRDSAEDFPPDSEPYARLARYWDDYASWFAPDYGRFLTAAGDYYGQPVTAVLDLACGTGLYTRQVAVLASSVVGLDASATMLAEARKQARRNVEYILGDF